MTALLTQLLSDAGRQMGLETLALDEQGSASLEIDSVVLNLESEDDGQTLVLFADVGAPPRQEETPAKFYETLLRANFFQLGTGGATLGMDRDAGMIALVQRIATSGLEAGQLVGKIEQFVNFAEAWTARVAELASADPSSDSPPGGAEQAGFLRI